MKIVTNNIEQEDAEDILCDVLFFIIPTIINKYLPNDTFEHTNSKLFDSCLEILKCGKFVQESTIQMLVTSIIGFAQDEKERALLLRWFKEDALTTK